MNRRIILVALLAATSLTGPALAADLYTKARSVVPVVAPVPYADWSGVYVGLEGGYGWGSQDGLNVPFNLNNGTCKSNDGAPKCDDFGEFQFFQQTLQDHNTGADILLGRVKQRGWLAGGFFGAQKQWGSWVLGIEGDVDAANIKGSVAGSASVSVAPVVPTGEALAAPAPKFGPFLDLSHSASLESKIDMLASVRGKVGFAPAPNWLLYGTGGAAFAHVENTLADDQSLFFGDFCSSAVSENSCHFQIAGSSSLTASAGTSMFGWAAGAGVDWKLPLDPGSALVFGVEYLHYGFPSQTVTLNGPNGASLSFNAKEDVDTIKGRISYLFSTH